MDLCGSPILMVVRIKPWKDLFPDVISQERPKVGSDVVTAGLLADISCLNSHLLESILNELDSDQ